MRGCVAPEGSHIERTSGATDGSSAPEFVREIHDILYPTPRLATTLILVSALSMVFVHAIELPVLSTKGHPPNPLPHEVDVS